ncbi:MAG: hypothetical protein JJU31_12485 [Wenzhouxiangella sp.]|nr:hypothetical protein [Wenzhouxiangella sp.]MCH8479451.1 hypothetical protein [Wenzhouxiangella sp.]
MPINAHKAIASSPLGYKHALNLSAKQEQSLRNARDEIRRAISAKFQSFASSLGDQLLFENQAPVFPRNLRSPKFRMQGSFSYYTCNQPAHMPPQEIDLDDGLFMPTSYFEVGQSRAPSVRSAAYFLIIEQILTPLCEEKGWQLIDKPSCIRVQIDEAMHTDLALYSVPDADFQRIQENVQSSGIDFSAQLMLEEKAYRMLSQDEIMLAHREDGWKRSDPRKLEDWFVDAVKKHGAQVRTVSRCLKGWRDFQWEQCRLSSIALMAAAVSVFERASAEIPGDRDDIALLRVAQDLPDILSVEVPNPVVDGERLDQGWTPEERNDFVERAKTLAERLDRALVNSTDQALSVEIMRQLLGGRFPNDLSLCTPDAGRGAKVDASPAPAALTKGMIDNIEAEGSDLAAVNKKGGGRYG